MTFGFQGCGVAPGAFHFAEMLVLSGVLTLLHKSMPCSSPLGKRLQSSINPKKPFAHSSRRGRNPGCNLVGKVSSVTFLQSQQIPRSII
jgi:hypothetical protein